MALNYQKLCWSCNKIQEEAGSHLAVDAPKSQLYRLFDQYHLKGTTLTAIAQAYPQVQYMAIRNHAHKHQHPSTQKLQQNFKRKTVLDRTYEARKREGSARSHRTDREEMIDAAMTALRDGDMKLSAAVLAKLLKDEADIEAKAKDQNIDILRIMTTSRSGELKGLVSTTVKEFDPWNEPDPTEADVVA